MEMRKVANKVILIQTKSKIFYRPYIHSLTLPLKLFSLVQSGSQSFRI